MIDHLDLLLRRLLRNRVAQLASDNQVRFQPPDRDWRRLVSTMTSNALNVYLVDLREHRKPALVLVRRVWCDLWHAELVRMRQALCIPVLEVDLAGSESGQWERARTRVETLMEMLR